ncbi:TRAP-type C4-dicarboxylate transport system permease small subunit [Planktotalea frisia]|jgi:TRAP-type C4-dicarboxylate transport system permease small subunit|uniref:TRAP transporter small permease protein n=1 Tax=Planktotalea frisia TaxID=696762 RepID=A0A1L9NU75_9RHOB|nr:TRAP transporter small permease subunit [Planktotalea frisia]OJI92752.1 tripartite ATP-independent periplasmic transporter, DctQ component [Planktotalea frisia]PZX24555.1 TRAP-type C4-dicarboxylate transport system permease small subunit [Planktotalea frisia]
MRDWSPVMGLPLWVWLFVLPSVLAAICFVAGPRIERVMRPIWRILDGVYFASGMIAAFFMVMILSLIVAQMVARWTGYALPGTTEFAGYAMAATSFFALCHAMMRGAHIRVSIILNSTAFLKKWLDIFAVFGAAVIATYFARFAVKANFFSEMLNDRTQGQDQIPEWLVKLFQLDFSGAFAGSAELVYTPVWIPQLAMSIGTILLAIALWDTLTRLLVTGTNPIVSESVE